MHIILFLLLSACNLYGPADPNSDTPQVFTVQAGSTASGLGKKLVDAGLVSSENNWKLFLKTSKAGSCLKAGNFEIRPNMSMKEIMNVLCGNPIPDDIPFTVVEGWRIRDIDKALAEADLIESGAYTLAAEKIDRYKIPFSIEGKTLEGYLFPDTYMISPSKFEVQNFIQRQLDAFNTKYYQHLALKDRTLNELVIMASLVEREEPNPANRSTVAGILWKRLDNSWNLGVDATSRYTLEDWNDRKAFLKKLRDPNDIYNTRLNGGLPPTPIGNPGIVALEAAYSPAESTWWYYLHDSNGQIHYGATMADHNRNKATYNVY